VGQTKFLKASTSLNDRWSSD